MHHNDWRRKNLHFEIAFISSSETVAYLKNYAIGETPSISVGVALEEAEKILEEIQKRNFTRVTEEADTELM